MGDGNRRWQPRGASQFTVDVLPHPRIGMASTMSMKFGVPLPPTCHGMGSQGPTRARLLCGGWLVAGCFELLEMVTEDERKYMWTEYAPVPKMRLNLGISRRLAPLVDNDIRRIKLLHALLLALPGSPVLYYGDEIGMGDNIWLPDRDGVRTPMQWTGELPGAGFSAANPYLFPARSPARHHSAVSRSRCPNSRKTPIHCSTGSEPPLRYDERTTSSESATLSTMKDNTQ